MDPECVCWCILNSTIISNILIHCPLMTDTAWRVFPKNHARNAVHVKDIKSGRKLVFLLGTLNLHLFFEKNKTWFKAFKSMVCLVSLHPFRPIISDRTFRPQLAFRGHNSTFSQNLLSLSLLLCTELLIRPGSPFVFLVSPYLPPTETLNSYSTPGMPHNCVSIAANS